MLQDERLEQFPSESPSDDGTSTNLMYPNLLHWKVSSTGVAQ